MILAGKLFVDLLGKYAHTYNKYDGIEEKDGKDGSQEGTKEDTRCTDETAERNNITELSNSKQH